MRKYTFFGAIAIVCSLALGIIAYAISTATPAVSFAAPTIAATIPATPAPTIVPTVPPTPLVVTVATPEDAIIVGKTALRTYLAGRHLQILAMLPDAPGNSVFTATVGCEGITLGTIAMCDAARGEFEATTKVASEGSNWRVVFTLGVKVQETQATLENYQPFARWFITVSNIGEIKAFSPIYHSIADSNWTYPVHLLGIAQKSDIALQETTP